MENGSDQEGGGDGSRFPEVMDGTREPRMEFVALFRVLDILVIFYIVKEDEVGSVGSEFEAAKSLFCAFGHDSKLSTKGEGIF